MTIHSWKETTRPLPRSELKQLLRHFLTRGQREWKRDGGVIVRKRERDPAMVPIWDCIVNARERRPTERIPWGDKVDGHVGTIWDLADFEGIPTSLYQQLEELLALEREQVEHFLLSGTYTGDVTSTQGALDLGLPFEVEKEWREGIVLDIEDPAPGPF
mmetsp:Transcript_40806/g.83477  ORF Transcript_40806/g.83477 Transcript_40806/m.83477 type:complete len:159 (-) Transcript_40806:1438-1914(-)